MAFIHLNLGLAESLVFLSVGVVLLLEEGNLLGKDLDLACRL